jgi:hypothetical protein
VALVRPDVSEEHMALTLIPENGVLHTHRRENIPVRYELCLYIPEDGILHSHRRENLKSYIILTGWAL